MEIFLSGLIHNIELYGLAQFIPDIFFKYTIVQLIHGTQIHGAHVVLHVAMAHKLVVSIVKMTGEIMHLKENVQVQNLQQVKVVTTTQVVLMPGILTHGVNAIILVEKN